MNESESLNACDCCEGVTSLTPALLANRPGLPALAYRVGTHGSFKATMIAAVAAEPGLSRLTARADDDAAIALLDAGATLLDVLTFYQERIANEGFLRTAAERRSLLELARAIGYELSPGVAAGVHLAFELETAPGAPPEATLPIGTKAQSLPGPDEKPQTFETVEAITARADLNRLKPQLTERRLPIFGDTWLYLQGIATNLKPGDPLLIVGQERLADSGSERWELRRISAVEPEAVANRTLIRWDEPLGSVFPFTAPPAKDPRVYALRLRAALFGHNAPDWHTLPIALRIGELNPQNRTFIPGVYANRQNSWAEAKFAASVKTIHLDAVYGQITRLSWLALAAPDYVELYRVTNLAEETKADFNLTAKATRLDLAGENINRFSPRTTTVYAQSEELPLAESPLTEPLQGDAFNLDRRIEGLVAKRSLIVSGRRSRVRLLKPAQLAALDGATAQVKAGETLIAAAAPVRLSPLQTRWTLLDQSGFLGSLTAPEGLIEVEAAQVDDPLVSEVVVIKRVTSDPERTRLELTASLANLYDRQSVVIYGNVARATHGETRREVLGSGNAAQPFQKFKLKQTPLTYVSAATAGGTASTLEVRVDDILWPEVASLHGLGPRDRAYITRRSDDGQTTIQFGDGLSGARLPTGVENVTVNYRTGLGAAGMVKAGQLSLLLSPPLGVRKVSNPLPPNGAADPESLDQARRNAPLTVLTLGRIVSLPDVEDFARAFAGIGQAQAAWLWNGESRLVHLTLAAAVSNGVDYRLEPSSDLFQNLRRALDAARDPTLTVRLDSYQPLYFSLAARVQIDPAYLPDKVLAAATAAVAGRFGFGQRAFGQPVHKSEILAALQAVEGMVAATLNDPAVDRLHLLGQPPGLAISLPAQRARWEAGQLKPAQLLLVDPGRVSLTEIKV